MSETISISIETSCRYGGLAMGRGESLTRVLLFDASRRHATQLLVRLDELCKEEKISPADIDELYVSVGPGSYTGLRVGVTVARTLAQVFPKIKLVAVPTTHAVAEALAGRPWSNLGVVLDARDELIYAKRFTRGGGDNGRAGDREGGGTIPAGEPAICTAAEFLAGSPRPLLLSDEGLGYHDLAAEGVELAEESQRFPTPECVWSVGRRLAAAGRFVALANLLPIYARAPQAVQMWEQKHAAIPR